MADASMQVCPTCKVEKSITDFYKQGPGHDTRCKSCTLARKRQHYADRKAGKVLTSVVTEALCPDCALIKPAAAFTIDHARPTGLKLYCRDCAQLRQMCVKYRITRLEAVALRARQEVGCEACGSTSRMVVDHDHETGKIRGILCDDCNVTLGRMKDSPERLMALAAYLLRQADLLEVR